MRTLMFASFIAALGLTTACTTGDGMKSSGNPSYTRTSDKPSNQADCERAGGKWKSVLHHCDMDD